MFQLTSGQLGRYLRMPRLALGRVRTGRGSAGPCGVHVALFEVFRAEGRGRGHVQYQRTGPGRIVYGCAMAALTSGASELPRNPAVVWSLLGACVFLPAVFCLLELKRRYPLLDLRLLARSRVFVLSSLAVFINYSSLFGMLFFQSLSAGVARHERAAGRFPLALQSVAHALTTPLRAPLQCLKSRLCLRRGRAPSVVWGSRRRAFCNWIRP